jgi:hypothetical protein
MGYLSLGAFPPCGIMHCLLIVSYTDRELVRLATIIQVLLSLIVIPGPSVNTFTEHRGSVWSVRDMQHTCVSETSSCGQPDAL